jgi:hypothetical protein
MRDVIEPLAGAGAARHLPLAATVALALGLQVQFVAPVGGGLKLAASDPVAVGVAAWAGVALVRGRRFMSLSPGRLILAFGAMATALAVGALVAAGTLGHVPIWAWAGRGLGLGLLAAYLVAAAYLCNGAASACGHARTAAIIVVATASVAAVAASATFVFGLTGRWFGVARPYEALSGFVENRNAFSLILLAALALLFAARRLRPERFGVLATAALLAILSLALLFAGSRAALPVAAAMLVAALALRWIGPGPVLAAAGAVALYVAAAWLAAMAWSPSGGAGGLAVVAPSAVGGQNDPSNIERWRSFGEAWRLFLARPLTGIGLGAFAEHQAATHGRALVVHNSALWILTEMGLVGAIGFGLAATLLLAPVAAAATRPEARIVRHAILMFLVAAAAMSLVHEILYQRVVWVMLGLGLAAQLPDRAVPGPPAA